MPAKALPRIPWRSDQIGSQRQLWHCRCDRQRCRSHCNRDLWWTFAQTYCCCWYHLVHTPRSWHTIEDRFVRFEAIAGAVSMQRHGERWHLDRYTNMNDSQASLRHHHEHLALLPLPPPHRWRRSLDSVEALENIRLGKSVISMANSMWCYVYALFFDATIQIWCDAMISVFDSLTWLEETTTAWKGPNWAVGISWCSQSLTIITTWRGNTTYTHKHDITHVAIQQILGICHSRMFGTGRAIVHQIKSPSA